MDSQQTTSTPPVPTPVTIPTPQIPKPNSSMLISVIILATTVVFGAVIIGASQSENTKKQQASALKISDQLTKSNNKDDLVASYLSKINQDKYQAVF